MTLGEIIKYAFLQSDTMGKVIVVILGLFSAWAWSILANKAMAINAKRNACKAFLKEYDQAGSPLALGVNLEKLTGPLKAICEAGLIELCDICEINGRRRKAFLMQGVLPRQLTQAETDKIKSTMNRQLNVETLELESELGALSVFVTVSPFLGLFGTVWGVMATFIAIARNSSVEISAIAPGISGALLTTVAGLFVAIPSVVGNIFITSGINKTCLEMDIFVDDFIASLKLEDSGSKDANDADKEDA